MSEIVRDVRGGARDRGATRVVVLVERSEFDMLEAELRAQGMSPIAASSAGEARRALGGAAALVADPAFDGGAGLDLIREAAEQGGRAVAATADAERARQALDAGAAAVVDPARPDPCVLGAALTVPADAAPEPPGGVDAARFGAHVDRAVYEELAAAMGPDLIGELLARVRADIAEQRDLLARAAPEGDMDGVRRATHVLISVAGAIGAAPLQREAEMLNRLANEARDDEVRAAADGLLAEAREVLAFVGER